MLEQQKGRRRRLFISGSSLLDVQGLLSEKSKQMKIDTRLDSIHVGGPLVSLPLLVRELSTSSSSYGTIVLERVPCAHVSFLEFGGWRTKVSGRASDSSSFFLFRSMTCPQNFVPTPHIQHHGISLIAARYTLHRYHTTNLAIPAFRTYLISYCTSE